MTRPARVVVVVGLVACALYVAHALLTDRVVDDCYITFRYVRNWVAGDGVVFNPGERVEGYTNFLWTALLAAAKRVSPGLDLLVAAQAMALVAGAALLGLVTRCAFSRRTESGLLRAFAPLLLAASAPFVAWSTGGLETTLFTLLVFAAAIAELAPAPPGRASLAAPLLLALATMARPDGIVFVGALALFRIWPRDRERGGLRPALAGLAVFALLYGPYWIWRYRYYGWPVPNTFYAKVGGGLAQWKRGVGYVLDWAMESGVLIALLPLVAIARRWRERMVRLFALNLAAGLFYVVAVGGESLGLFRFMVPLAPFFALLAQEGLLDVVDIVRGRTPAAGRGAVARALAGAVVVVSLVFAARPTLGPTLWPRTFHATQAGLTFPDVAGAHSYRWFDNYFVDRLAVAGRWIDAHAQAGDLVASSPAGSIGFHMRQPLLDMLGLNDVTIAHESVPDMGTHRAGHEKGDGRYVLARRPRFILLGNVAVAERPLEDAEVESRCARLKSERELYADPEFHRLYAKKSVPIGAAELVHVAPANRRLFQWLTLYELREAPR